MKKTDLCQKIYINDFLMIFGSKNCYSLLILLCILLLGKTFHSNAQNVFHPQKPDPGCVSWVDSVYSRLTPAQRVAQLLMIRANSVVDSGEIRQVAAWIRQYNIGGICFFKGGPLRQAILTNYYQSMAATPILISMDAEWGLGMRLDSTIAFARQMTLGAMADESLITRYGEEMARQLRRIGVQVSFSPVADINNNPANPVINVRSFGEDRKDVARKALLYMKGLQKGGVMSVAKHFPGHGDTDTDSHLALPVIDHSAETIDTLELYPFKKLIEAGVDGIMIAHLFIPALDSSRNLPSSLSKIVVNDLLKNKLGFKGVIFTDALDMKGAANFAPQGMVEVKALEAGNDVLLLPESVDSAVQNILAAVDSGLISQTIIEERCKKMLALKYKLGISQTQTVKVEGLVADLNTPMADYLNRTCYGSAVTLLKNDGGLLPIQRQDTLKIACVTIGFKDETQFQQRLSSYAAIDHYSFPRDPEARQLWKFRTTLDKYNLVIVNINNTHPSPLRDFGISEVTTAWVDTLLASKPCVLNVCALPYSVALFRNADKAQSVIISYQDNATAYDASAQLIFGGIMAKGHTPVSISARFPLHSGLPDANVSRFKFTLPEDADIPSASLARVDSIVREGMQAKAYPGCQVLIAVNGKVIYSKSFGYHDYSNKEPVLNSDIYDLASVTKVAATTLAVMKLHDEHKIDPKKPLSRYLPMLDNSNKNKISVQEVMAHQAGLVAWIPFYKKAMEGGKWDSAIFSRVADSSFSLRVAENLYVRKDYPAWMLDSIVRSPLSPKKEYKYSDLGFILMQQAIEHIAGMPLDQYVKNEFYSPMGLPTLGFHPRETFPLKRIIPTENDTVFRRQVVHGDVHDPAAAMMGGVAGHAGLFGNATDLAALFQMLLQHGNYGGQHYLDSSTIEEFTSRQFPGNRRGLGFDKPQDPGEEGPACADASPRSFGHTGFTGTYVWADPDNQMILVFLSNRVNPDAEDNKLVKLGTRTKIQQVVYDAIRESNKQVSPARKLVNSAE
ncbi:MAG: serine hydrolase [Bacteroidetes bacterium]|nr:serine hydrolase [Bacteroidota bacterium]